MFLNQQVLLLGLCLLSDAERLMARGRCQLTVLVGRQLGDHATEGKDMRLQLLLLLLL